MTTYLGKSCSFCLPRVPFVNCRQFMYLVISLLVLRAGYGIWLYQSLIIAYLFTLKIWSFLGLTLFDSKYLPFSEPEVTFLSPRTVLNIRFRPGQAYLYWKGRISPKIWRHHKPEVAPKFQLRRIPSSWVNWIDLLHLSQNTWVRLREGGGELRLFSNKHMRLSKNTLI